MYFVNQSLHISDCVVLTCQYLETAAAKLCFCSPLLARLSTVAGRERGIAA